MQNGRICMKEKLEKTSAFNVWKRLKKTKWKLLLIPIENKHIYINIFRW